MINSCKSILIESNFHNASFNASNKRHNCYNHNRTIRFLQGDTSGDYKRALLTVVGGF